MTGRMARVLLPLVTVALGCGGGNDGGGGLPTEERLAAEACARITGCFDVSDGSQSGFDTCLGILTGSRGTPQPDVEETNACVMGAADCDAVGLCINAGEPAATCDPATTDRTCDGDVARRCYGVFIGEDCGAEGTGCVTDDIGQLGCGPGDPCDGIGTCEGDIALVCRNGVTIREDCSPGTCNEGFCTGGGEECDEPVFRCDGNVAVTCRNGRIQRQECVVCSEADGAFCATDDECERSTCDGTVLLGCVDGRIHQSDCAALGFTACEQTETGARCTS